METGRKKFHFIGLIFALLLAGELSFVVDMLTTRAVTNLPAKVLALVFAVSFLLFAVLGLLRPKLVKWCFLLFTAVVVLLSLFLYLVWYSVYRDGTYMDADQNKAQVFGGKRVMAIVPHEGDELYLLGGMLEQYVKYGSDVFVVYVTNGDLSVSGAQRINEAENAMGQAGIPPENLIFLGYGEQLGSGTTPLYLCPEDEELTSAAGFSSTYGTDRHRPFSPGASYTRRNMYEDIKTVLLRYTPDVVFCTDMDEDIDHQAVAMFFERAMGEVLKLRPAYEPLILRGFAYSMAFCAPGDYYAVNILSTIKPGEQEFITDSDSNVYNWDERLRLPVHPNTLSRSLLNSGGYTMAGRYTSQNALKQADGIVNGDKVFWQRESASLSYEAEFWVSSGNGELLKDFILTDRTKAHDAPGRSDNTWVPEAGDSEKRVIIKFPTPTVISRIVLYDDPSLENNVLTVSVKLDNGRFYKAEPRPNGSGTELCFEPSEVEQLEITLMDTEGSGAGLTEIELFSGEYEPPFSFVKLTNARGISYMTIT